MPQGTASTRTPQAAAIHPPHAIEQYHHAAPERHELEPAQVQVIIGRRRLVAGLQRCAAPIEKTRWCVLKRRANLTGQQRFRLCDLLRYNLQTVRAYLLKEDFQQFWEYEPAVSISALASSGSKVIPFSATNMRTFVGRPAFAHGWAPYCFRGLARALLAFIRNSGQRSACRQCHLLVCPVPQPPRCTCRLLRLWVPSLHAACASSVGRSRPFSDARPSAVE